MIGLPIFKAEFIPGHGIDTVSIVDRPATEFDYMLFEKAKEQALRFAADEERQIIRAVIMRADFPIYRVDEQGREFYIVFDGETLRDMARDAVKTGGLNAFSFNHDGKEVAGIELVQLFVKDVKNGINPVGFEEIEDGSLFGEWKVTDADVWERVKTGNFGGISIEGIFNLKRENMNKLQKFLRQAPEVETPTLDGVLFSDEPLAPGVHVYVKNEDGDFIDAPDGQYTTESGDMFIVGGGILMQPEFIEEEEVTEEVTEEVKEDISEHDQAIDIIKEDLNVLTGVVNALKEELQALKEEIHAPQAVPPVVTKYGIAEGRFEKMVNSIKR